LSLCSLRRVRGAVWNFPSTGFATIATLIQRPARSKSSGRNIRRPDAVIRQLHRRNPAHDPPVLHALPKRARDQQPSYDW
jgi:hypothetical protein